MRFRTIFSAGFAAGYVVGARAGRERYDQIARLSRRIAERPEVQETAGVLQAQASNLAQAAKSKVTRRHDDRDFDLAAAGSGRNGHGAS